MNSNIGKKIEGRYEITDLIGVGGMANVYKATDVTDGKIVAVKILREEFIDNEEFLRRFKNESKAIALLEHPNIIQVYDVCFSEKLYSIVMEFVDGITLKEYIESRGALPYKEALHFIVQVLAALEHAHDRGIVHRDVKPQNVMLLSDGQIKITDFGIARFARSEAKTITDRAIGSVHYISPEQARGGSTDNRTDLYSVGVLLYEMLCGKLPFEGDTPVSIALKHIELEAPALRDIDPEIPEGLEQIVKRAMQKEPDERYQSAREMSDDIVAFKRDPSISFAYQYLDTTDKTEFKRSLMKAQTKKKQGDKAPAKDRRTGGRSRLPEEPAAVPKERKSVSVIPILGGITAAFVLVSGVFIAIMIYLNNPFQTVPNVTMPNLVGMNYEELKNDPNYQFTYEVEDTQFSYNYANGVIYDQNPKPGRTVKESARIKLKVSLGPEEITIPNLIGKEASEAYSILTESKLEYRTIEVFSSMYEVGTVVATEPNWGSVVQGNTIVQVQVSMGPEIKYAPVPELTGLDLADARTIIDDMGFQVGSVNYIASDMPYNTVVSQDPSSEGQMVQGGFINLVLSQGAGEVKTMTLTIPLPQNITSPVEIQAMVAGATLHSATVTPSEDLYWTPSFEGSTAAEVMIFINGGLYQVWSIDYTTESANLIENNENSF